MEEGRRDPKTLLAMSISAWATPQPQQVQLQLQQRRQLQDIHVANRRALYKMKVKQFGFVCSISSHGLHELSTRKFSFLTADCLEYLTGTFASINVTSMHHLASDWRWKQHVYLLLAGFVVSECNTFALFAQGRKKAISFDSSRTLQF
jgi:hypothetical protein